MAKYDPIGAYLAERSAQSDEVRMSFVEIERLVGPLPESARVHRAWWANDSKVQAQAWRAAGWHVDSVNQGAGWVIFRKGRVGGTRLAAARLASSVEGHPQSTSCRTASNAATSPDATGLGRRHVEDLTEAAVQAALVAYLAAAGWRIERVADTATKERGVDVLAARGDRRVAVEVKGYPSRTYADPRRAGEVKPTSPSTQARHWFAQAVLAAMLTRDSHPGVELAIALPDVSTYRSLHRRTAESLRRLLITTFWVGGDGAVTEG